MVLFSGHSYCTRSAASQGAAWQSFRQSNYNREIKERNETIMRLQNNIISQVTGGDSFIYLRTTDPIKNAKNMMLSMAFPTLSGRYSLHDVQIQIFGSLGGIIYLHYDLVSPNSPILEPRYIELLFPEIISGVVDLTVFITSSAGTLFQTIRLPGFTTDGVRQLASSETKISYMLQLIQFAFRRGWIGPNRSRFGPSLPNSFEDGSRLSNLWSSPGKHGAPSRI